MDVTEHQNIWNQRIDLLITLAVFLGVISLYSPSWFYSLLGGKSTVGAERVLNGEIPYRDFWTMYAPGHFYLLALLFRIFGTHFLVNVVAASVVCAAAACICYQIVLNLVNKRAAALSCAAIFFAATYNTAYFKTLGSYPPAILFILAAILCMVMYYRSGKITHLITSGLATGVVIVFKHDVGGYTAIAIVSGLITHSLTLLALMPAQRRLSILGLVVFSTSVTIIVLPVLIYFAVLTGPDMLENLIVFPLTDFRFARPEGYPSLVPLWIYDESRLMMLAKFIYYVTFAVPFALFLLGLIAIVLAVKKRRPEYVALGVTFSVGYILHYSAAHIQINTHIITMSVYALISGIIFYELIKDKLFRRKATLARVLTPMFVVGWLLCLSARPVYDIRKFHQLSTAELQLKKVSGFKVTPKDKQLFESIASFVNNHVPAEQKLFVGLHRHDVVVMGDTLMYFLMDRPSATRYHELHPAITDTADVQNEIIDDLRRKDVSYILLKHIFPDKVLEKVKEDFLKHLPKVGATILDKFIRKNYTKIKKFGPYEVWEKNRKS